MNNAILIHDTPEFCNYSTRKFYKRKLNDDQVPPVLDWRVNFTVRFFFLFFFFFRIHTFTNHLWRRRFSLSWAGKPEGTKSTQPGEIVSYRKESASGLARCQYTVHLLQRLLSEIVSLIIITTQKKKKLLEKLIPTKNKMKETEVDNNSYNVYSSFSANLLIMTMNPIFYK